MLALRAAMNEAGFNSTRIIVMDGGFDDQEVAMAQAQPEYRQAIFGAGLHYPCNKPHPEVQPLMCI